MSRKVFSVTTNGGRTGFFNSLFLMAGDFCGEEILIWASDPSSSSKLPISTRTVQTISEVEAFALMSEDLKLLASEFRNHGGKQLHHALRQGLIVFIMLISSFSSLMMHQSSLEFVEPCWELGNKVQI